MFTNSTDGSGISLENPGSPLCQKKAGAPEIGSANLIV